MRLVVVTDDGGTLNIDHFDAETLIDLIEEYEANHLLTFAVDGGMAYIPSHRIVAIHAYDADMT